jgi:hypothetical protein
MTLAAMIDSALLVGQALLGVLIVVTLGLLAFRAMCAVVRWLFSPIVITTQVTTTIVTRRDDEPVDDGRDDDGDDGGNDTPEHRRQRHRRFRR